jgi:hypothetical protein
LGGSRGTSGEGIFLTAPSIADHAAPKDEYGDPLPASSFLLSDPP